MARSVTDPLPGNPILTEFFRHNFWANMALADFCLALPDNILETAIPGTYGEIRRTLAHMAGAEERHLSALTNGPERRNPTLEQTNPDLAAAREHLRQSSEGLIAFAERVEGDPTLTVTWHGETYEMPVSLFLVQAINHATDHRTQIKTALTQAGIEPPELDGWNWDDARQASRD
jgi:uncharacterized damage-inducible protein DinB